MSTVESLREEFEAATAALGALYEELPPRAMEMPEPYVNGRGEQVDAHRGWTDEERARVAAAREHGRQLAVKLHRARATATTPPAE